MENRNDLYELLEETSNFRIYKLTGGKQDRPRLNANILFKDIYQIAMGEKAILVVNEEMTGGVAYSHHKLFNSLNLDTIINGYTVTVIGEVQSELGNCKKLQLRIDKEIKPLFNIDRTLLKKQTPPTSPKGVGLNYNLNYSGVKVNVEYNETVVTWRELESIEENKLCKVLIYNEGNTTYLSLICNGKLGGIEKFVRKNFASVQKVQFGEEIRPNVWRTKFKVTNSF